MRVGSQSFIFGSGRCVCFSGELVFRERMAIVQRLGPCGVKTGFQAEAKAYANAESGRSLCAQGGLPGANKVREGGPLDPC